MQPTPERSQSQGRLADKVAVLEAVDGFAPLRNGLRLIAKERGDWAGIPMPLDGMRLVIEPKYPNAEKFAAIGAPPEDPEEATVTIRNRFWSHARRGEIVIYKKDGGKVEWGLIPGVHHFKYDLATLGAADVWGIEQEHNAVQLLGTLLRHRNFKQYLLTGMFLETSKRSGLTYMFRRLKPTVVMAAHSGEMKILCTLCLHPIAHYEGSWAGAMTPTDDVVAHLMLMRGDEPLYWKRANQHPPHRPESGL